MQRTKRMLLEVRAGIRKMGEGGQKKQTSSYKILYINGDVIYDMVTIDFRMLIFVVEDFCIYVY